ncbi:hypothetical protein DXG01_003083 [Tephrocybe rancida]|nr:hypothetical protein DXG01_003083 [Tephrocybe rancida]
MPKVVSRSAVSSSTDDCICGEFILVIDKSLATLPRRKTDNSIIMRTQDSDAGKARVFKLNAVSGDPILLERCAHSFLLAANVLADMEGLGTRPGGHERQYRFNCPRCNLAVGYQSLPPAVKSAPFFYILAGALTQHQGQVPQGALDEDSI